MRFTSGLLQERKGARFVGFAVLLAAAATGCRSAETGRAANSNGPLPTLVATTDPIPTALRPTAPEATIPPTTVPSAKATATNLLAKATSVLVAQRSYRVTRTDLSGVIKSEHTVLDVDVERDAVVAVPEADSSRFGWRMCVRNANYVSSEDGWIRFRSPHRPCAEKDLIRSALRAMGDPKARFVKESRPGLRGVAVAAKSPIGADVMLWFDELGRVRRVEHPGFVMEVDRFGEAVLFNEPVVLLVDSETHILPPGR
jgi:hypothetical protein